MTSNNQIITEGNQSHDYALYARCLLDIIFDVGHPKLLRWYAECVLDIKARRINELREQLQEVANGDRLVSEDVLTTKGHVAVNEILSPQALTGGITIVLTLNPHLTLAEFHRLVFTYWLDEAVVNLPRGTWMSYVESILGIKAGNRLDAMQLLFVLQLERYLAPFYGVDPE